MVSWYRHHHTQRWMTYAWVAIATVLMIAGYLLGMGSVTAPDNHAFISAIMLEAVAYGMLHYAVVYRHQKVLDANEP